MRYYYQGNTVYFDNAQLVKDISESYTYDKDGNLTAVSAGEGEDSAFVYNNKHDLTSVKDAEDNIYQYTYDSAHRVTKAVAPLNQVIEFTYDDSGNVTSTLIGNSEQNARIKTATGYNTATNGISAGAYAVSEINEMGDTVSYDYDLQSGQLLKATDTDGRETVYTYKTGTDLLERTESGGRSVSYVYNDKNTQLTSIHHNGMTYDFEYDKYGNTERVLGDGQLLVSNTYAAGNGKLVTSTYGNGDHKDFHYDKAGNLTSIEVNDTEKHVWEYDNSQQLVRYTDKESQRKTTYGYDITGRVSGFRVHDAQTEDSAQDTLLYESEYAYNDTGSITDEIINAGGHSHSYSYTYNKNGQPLELEAEGIQTTIGYESLGRMSGKSVSLGTELNYDYEYNLSGWNEEGSSEYQTTQLAKELIGNLGYSYTYDSRGNILSISEGTRASGTTTDIDNQTLKVSYVYDELGQLVRENNVWSNRTNAYEYDQRGNITSRTEYAYTTVEDLSEVIPINTIVYSYSGGIQDRLAFYNGRFIWYDEIGNPLNYYGCTLDWEGRNLVSIESPYINISYKYDVDGIRTEKTVGDITSSYYYSGGRLSYEKRGEKELFYIYDAYGNLSMLKYYDGSGQSSLYHVATNSRGDVEMLYHADGTVAVRYFYDAWGNLISMKDDAGNEITSTEHIGQINPIRYRGYYYDTETGFYYLNSRYYAPEVGRFISADNVVSGVGQSVQGYNLYSYCFNNPVNMSDSDGNRGEWAQKIVNTVKKTVSKVVNKVKTVVNKVKQDVKNYDRNNTSEQKVIDSNYFSAYKGKVVIRTNMNRSASVGVLLISRKIKDHQGDPIDEIRHEYGHTKQLDQLGIINYALCIGVPSALQWGSDPEYYRRPWEITADIYGGVQSRSYPEYEAAGFEYLENSKKWGPLVWLTID